MSSSNQGFLERNGKKVRWGAIAVLLGSLVVLMRALPVAVLQGALERWVAGLGVWGPIVFGLVYVAATVLLIPASLLTLAGGAVFGLGVGFVTVSLASTTGAAFAFLIARYLARAKVKKMAESNANFGAIDAAISEGGWRIVAMLRLSPAVPFGLQNYLYGLTDLAFLPYVLTSWIAMVPGTLLYVYLGVAAKTAAGGGEGKSPAQWALLVVGLLATIAVTVYITRLAQKKLAERTQLDGVVANEPATEPTEKQAEDAAGPSAGAVMGTVGAAALVLVLAVFAQMRSDSITQYVEGLVGTSEAPAANR